MKIASNAARCPPTMQAPVIVMNDASARQTGRKAQTSNITAAKVNQIAVLCLTLGRCGCHTYLSWTKSNVENATRPYGRCINHQ